jgi:hypothetical protein
MSKSTVPVLTVYDQELKTPETLGVKLQRFLQKNHKTVSFAILMPDRDPQPIRTGDPKSEL